MAGILRVLGVVLLFAVPILAAPPAALLDVHVWPQPAKMETGKTTVFVDSSKFRFESSCQSPDLQAAFARFQKRLFPFTASDVSKAPVVSVASVYVSDASAPLRMGHNETYSLHIPSDGSAITIHAGTVYGAYHALETLAQIVVFSHEEHSYVIRAAPYAIEDTPRFPYRLLLIDTSRHYLPMVHVKRLVDSMAHAKLNVLHWHITDHESIPMESDVAPKFWEGAFSDYERFTMEEVKELIEYARQRGIRVVPEIDTPGHASAFCLGNPEICPSATCKSPLDPTKEETFNFLRSLFGEMKGIFFDDYFHLGGDEVDMGCWTSTPHIQEWLTAKNWTNKDAYYYFVDRAVQITKSQGKIPVVWEEVFLNFKGKLDKDTLVHVWLGDHHLGDVTNAGYSTILSNAHPWYLPQQGFNWTEYYLNNITLGVAPANLHLVKGGGPAMWGEWVDPSDLFNSVWPRAAAAAEVLWTPEALLDVNRADLRFRWFRCYLIRNGIGAGPVDGKGPRILPPNPGSCFAQ